MAHSHPAQLELKYIPLNKILIQIDPEDGLPINPRGTVGNTGDLEETIASQGLLTPLLVRPVPDREGYYYLRHGHRRLTAVGRMGWQTVACNVQAEGDWVSDTLDMLAAGTQEEYPALSVARRVVRLKAAGLNNKEIAAAWGGKSPDTISAYEHLLDAPQEMQAAIMDGRVGVTVFACIKKLPPEEQLEILEAHEGEITMSQVKAYRKQRKANGPAGFVRNAMTMAPASATDLNALYQQVIVTLNEIETAMATIEVEQWPPQVHHLHDEVLEQLARIRPSVSTIQPSSPQRPMAPKWQTLRLENPYDHAN